MNEEFAKDITDKLIECNDFNEEDGHIKADELLCELLIKLGHTEVVEAFKSLKKWYS